MVDPVLSIHFDYGGIDAAPATHADIDNSGPPKLKFKIADNATIDTSNKIVRPAAGLGPYYSALKHIHIYLDTANANTISDIKIYSSGTNPLGTGIDLNIGLQFPTNNSGASGAQYEVATANPTTTDMVAEHSIITSSASIFTYTAASPLSLSISEAGAVMNADGEMSNYFILQMSVANTATTGTAGYTGDTPLVYIAYTIS